MSITISDFAKIEIKVGRIISVDDIPAARNPMYKLIVELGGGVNKQCVAGIKKFYIPQDLIGRHVVVVVNLEPKSVAGVISECMLLAASDENQLSLLSLDRDIPPGAKIS
jgi:methionine--tRNA ligase beta chain